MIGTSGGGVACYIRNNICFNRKNCLSDNVENIFIDLLLLASKRFCGGAYLGQVSFMCDMQLSSFQNSNVFIVAESWSFGCFWVVFGHNSPKCPPHPCLRGGSSENILSEVVHNVMLLIYLSLEAVRYIP